MAEPVSSGVGAAAIVKFYGLITILSIAASLAYLIVVMTREPRSRKEWVISLVTTLVEVLQVVHLSFNDLAYMTGHQTGSVCVHWRNHFLLRITFFGPLCDGPLTISIS
jgi:hypothetical protein